jgi:hypothetical protein
MKDVGNLDNRISNIEEYVSLSKAENSTIHYDVIDTVSRLTRFKSGYLVDEFDNPDMVSDINNLNFKVAYSSGKITPQFEIIDIPLSVSLPTDVNIQVNTDTITLKYEESIFAQQQYSSKQTNINPFSVFSWKGFMTISPSKDSWIEVENISKIITSQTNTIKDIVNIRRSWNHHDVTGTLSAPIQTPTFPPIPLPILYSIN